ncbi:MAG: hypothetical protein MUC88_00295 [Planctomycetes bacterium]|jgi:hypothetical protein|nr:hypothetical protein [Planctomycetota bacterium]
MTRTFEEMLNSPQNPFEESMSRAVKKRDEVERASLKGQRLLFDRRGKVAGPDEVEPRPNGPEDVGYRRQIQTPATEARDRQVYGQSITRLTQEGPPERVDPRDVELIVGVDPAVPEGDHSRKLAVIDGMVMDVTPLSERQENVGETGWPTLMRQDGQLFGLDPISHQILDLVRGRDSSTQGLRELVSRLWRPEDGVIAGLTSGMRCPGFPDKGLMLADDAGVALLRGKLPQKPDIPVEGTGWEGKLKASPWSDIRWIAVAVGLEELCWASHWANKLATIEKWSAVPVLGLMAGDFDGLARVKRPKGSGLLVANKELRAWIDDEMWGTKTSQPEW